MFKVKRRFGGGGAEFLIFKPMIKKFKWVDSEFFVPIDVKE